MSNKVALFYNPVAGGGEFKRKLDSVVLHFQNAGLQIIPWRIVSNNEIMVQAGKISSAEYHSVIAAGGDGTIHGVVNAMMKLNIDVPLGIFPEGTVNDVASYLNIPDKTSEYCKIITSGNKSTIDLAQVNDEYFINVASAGLLAQTAHEVDHHLKNVFGKMAYYMKTLEKLPKLQPLQLHVNADGQVYDMEMMLFMVLNGGTAGGFQGLVPQANMSDGILDFLAIKPVPIHRFTQLLYYFNRGLHLKDNSVLYFQAKHLLIDVEPHIVTDLDGEKGPDFPWEIRTISNALQIWTP
ncbi:MAG: YegS/Rv2252/BmrU family lipid kinase [Syntrophomonas sp.]|nr:YegS/Rv2252/BmrU family lipid kinase [Syntrophomonas sp.]